MTAKVVRSLLAISTAFMLLALVFDAPFNDDKLSAQAITEHKQRAPRRAEQTLPLIQLLSISSYNADTHPSVTGLDIEGAH